MIARLIISTIKIYCFTLLLFPICSILAKEETSKGKLIQSIQQRVQDLNERMRKMGASDLPAVNTPNESPSFSEKNTLDKLEPKSSKFNKNGKKKPSSLKKSSFEPNTGFYFLPFGGLAMVDDFNLEFAGFNSTIETDDGFSLGTSVGYRWKYFYLEERISYLEAKIEKTNLAGVLPIQPAGDISNLSFHQSIGLIYNFNKWLGIDLGLGLGVSSKEVNFTYGENFKFQEDDWVFSYDGTIGIFFQPSGYFRGGINYRWLKTEDLDQFSGTDMHLVELALGLQF